MFVRYSIVELPYASSPAEAGALLDQFATTALPAAVIHNTGDTLRESTENIRPYVPYGVSLEPTTAVFKFGTENEMGDVLGLHLDYNPAPPGLETIKITHHFAVSGIARASFFRLGEGWKRVWEPAAGHQPLMRLVDSLKQGYTDPDILQPPCYRTISRPGTRIIFKNGLPVAHEFQRLSRTRASHAYDSLLLVHPDMQILTDPAADRDEFYTGPYTG
jgi:hypothetical protein